MHLKNNQKFLTLEISSINNNRLPLYKALHCRAFFMFNIPLSLTESIDFHMSKHFLAILIFCMGFFSFCKTPKHSTSHSNYIVLEETPMPSAQLPYSFKIFSDGQFIYQEKAGIKSEGHIDKTENKKLWDMIAKANLFQLKNNYLNNAEDTPPAKITYRKGSETKQITFQPRAPELLKKLVVQIKKIRRQSAS